MLRKKIFLLTLFCLSIFSVQAAKVDTLMVNSPSMNKKVKVVVITPDTALGQNATDCPVVYLLHGYSGNAFSWIDLKPDLPEIADKKGFIFVCPDAKNSWYWDSPKNPSYRYETFVSSELVSYIDSHYKTRADRSGRAITGLSMGGHGALWLAFRHKDVFGAAGSTSGGVDIRPFPTNWEIRDQLGEFAANKKSWDEHAVVNQIDNIQPGDLALIIDCGESDFFLNVNKDLHERLLAHHIGHDFITRPGVHNAAYWRNSIDYQILFFSKFFAH
ncbi:alpha/beta hydrolase family protein [uncultured Bacteroides sp.]|uniref:alpha/beta hydrolase n=1 Tax=uncultured Bacteroides sp. TaxID=162156 RepID=UPI002AABB336|nr:alpha/beta hydrolase family protein [uncultured Bacteroides sp.]